MKAETTTQQKLNIISHFIRMYRCVEKFEGLKYEFSGTLRKLGSGPTTNVVLLNETHSITDYNEEYNRPLSTAESLALGVLSGDPIAASALADYMQEQGLYDIEAVVEQRVQERLERDREVASSVLRSDGPLRSDSVPVRLY